MRLAEATKQIDGYLDGLRAQQALETALEEPGSRIGPLVLDHERRRVRGSISYVQLGRQQYILFAKLCRRPGVRIDRSDLIAALYADDPNAEPDSAEEVVRLRIMELRRSLMLLGNSVAIKLDRGIGYYVEVVR